MEILSDLQHQGPLSLPYGHHQLLLLCIRTQIPVPTQGLRQGLTFDAFLESLAPTLIGPPPLPLLGGLLCFPTVCALHRGQWERTGFPRDPLTQATSHTRLSPQGLQEPGQKRPRVPGARCPGILGRPSLCWLLSHSRSAHLPAGAMGPPGGGDELLQASLLHTQGTLNIKEDHGPQHVKTGGCQGRTWFSKEPATCAPLPEALDTHHSSPTIRALISPCNCLLDCEH